MKQWELRGVTVDHRGFPPTPPSPPAPTEGRRGSRLCSAAGLARLRAEARLIRRFPREYRRALAGGHAQAVQSLVREHRRQYDGFLLEALVEYDRLLGRGG